MVVPQTLVGEWTTSLFYFVINITLSKVLVYLDQGFLVYCIIQFPYGLEPTGLYVLLCWCFIGINPKSTPPNTLIKLANT